MSKTHYLITILLSFPLLLNTSCSNEAIKSLSDLSTLRNELIKKYKEENINVTVQNSHVLGISLINSSFNNLGGQERENKAREIALFANNHYPSIASIDKIFVSFVVSKSFIIFHYSNGLDTYVFEKSDLTSTAMSNKTGQQGIVTATYNPTANQTSVYLNKNLQVYSKGRSGIMLFPHFTISGDSATPNSAILDFSSYSEKRMFTNNPKLIIYVDNQEIFSGTTQTTEVLGTNAEKSVNEFLSQEISYNHFLQLTNGKQVKFRLGTTEFELTAGHLEALRAMKRCVEESRCI